MDITRRRSCRVRLHGRRIRVIPVGTPFTNIAAHVVYAQLVWGFSFNWVTRTCIAFITPSHIIKVIAATENIPFRLITASSCVLPLRLSGQAKSFTRQFVELRDKALTVVPRNLFHGAHHIARKVRGVAAHNCTPKFLSHLCLADIVALSKRYLMNRLFIIISIIAPHLERSTLNSNHLKGNAVDGIFLVFSIENKAATVTIVRRSIIGVLI